jgi:hypothetical protein
MLRSQIGCCAWSICQKEVSVVIFQVPQSIVLFLSFMSELRSAVILEHSSYSNVIQKTCTLFSHHFSDALLQIQMKLLDLNGTHATKLLRASAMVCIIFMRSGKLSLLFTWTSNLQTYCWMTIWCQKLQILVYRGSLVKSKLEHALEVVREHRK